MPDDDPGVGYKRCKDAFIGIVIPVRAMHYELPATAYSELKNLKGVGKALGPPPQSQEIWRRKGAIYLFW